MYRYIYIKDYNAYIITPVITFYWKDKNIQKEFLKNLSSQSKLTKSQFSKYVRKVFLKPLFAFGWLRHVLAILMQKHFISAESPLFFFNKMKLPS